MSKRMSIDELFHDKLSGGKEQLNLGAWANMERLLEGKNPYEKEEEKKKRRIVPLFWILFLLGTAVSAGYYLIAPLGKNSTTNKNIGTAQNLYTSANVTNNNNTNSQQDPLKPLQENETPTTLKDEALHVGNNQTKLPSSDPETENSATRTHVSKTVNPVKRIKSSKKTLACQAQHTALSTFPEQSQNANDATTNTPTQTNLESAKNEKTSITPLISPERKISKTKKEVQLSEKTTLNKNGTIAKIEHDTLSVTNSIINATLSNTEEQTATSKEALDYHLTNPRYVDLNEAQQSEAQQEIVTVSISNDVTLGATLSEEKQVEKNHSTNSDVSLHNSIKQNTKKQKGFFDYLAEAATVYWKNIEETARTISSKKLILYPGIIVGLDYSNAKHNYGGFHIGVTNTIPINNYFTILSELKLFYRKNTGFTVKDTKTIVKNEERDGITLANENKTIYTTEYENTTRKYNFKNFYSVEMPLALQFHTGKFSIYGGLNGVYNARLNTKMTLSTSIDTEKVILANNVTHVTNEKSYDYLSEDFGHRLGLGYLVGASFAWNNVLSMDLRLNQTIWDNSKNIYSREISNNVFRVPYLQLSLAYRFKKFDPKNR